MNCEQVKGHLSAYLDNALSFEERLYVATHVEKCLYCRHILADFSHFDALLAQLPRVSPESDLRERFFSSQGYLELVGTSYSRRSGSAPEGIAHLVPYSLPRSISLPGDRRVHERSASFLAKTVVYVPPVSGKRGRRYWRRWLFCGMVMFSILLTFGIGGLIRWKLWRWQERPACTAEAAVMPHQKSCSASTRFPFCHDFTAISQKTPKFLPLFHRCSV